MILTMKGKNHISEIQQQQNIENTTFTEAAKSIQPITNFFNYSNSHENDAETGYENDTESDGEQESNVG